MNIYQYVSFNSNTSLDDYGGMMSSEQSAVASADFGHLYFTDFSFSLFFYAQGEGDGSRRAVRSSINWETAARLEKVPSAKSFYGYFLYDICIFYGCLELVT